MCIFRLENINFSYGPGVPALLNVSLKIEQGEKIAILGANGSGKSTLIKLLDGLIHPGSGAIDAFGEELTEAKLRDDAFSHRFRRRVGFIFQNSDAQLFCSTVRDELAFAPLQMGLPTEEVEQRISEVAAVLNIEKLINRSPFQLSGGEKKKVAIAGSLVVNPDVILLDEPTNGLDPRSQRWLVELLVSLHDAGKTIITSTHDLNIVPEISDRVIVFSEDHKIVAEGETMSVLANKDLLLRVNLIHEHAHKHAGLWHAHPDEAAPHQPMEGGDRS